MTKMLEEPLIPPPLKRIHAKMICDVCGKEISMHEGKICDVKWHFICSGCVPGEGSRRHELEKLFGTTHPLCPLCLQGGIPYSELKSEIWG